MDPINQWQGLLSSPFQRQPREMAFKAAKGSKSLLQRMSLLHTLDSHRGCVNTVIWNESGQYVLSGSDDHRLIVTEPFTKRVVVDLMTSHRANIFSAKFLPGMSDKKIVSCAGDGTLLYTDLERAVETHGCTFTCHCGTAYELLTIQGDPNTFLSCGEDGTVRWFDLRTKDRCHKPNCMEDILISLNNAVTSMSLNPLLPYHLAVGSSDASVRIFDRRMLGTKPRGCMSALVSRFLLPEMEGKRRRITSIDYRPDGEEVLVSFSSDYIYTFDPRANDSKRAKRLYVGRPPQGAHPSGRVRERSPPPLKRLRLRGDWSDTGPNARPENQIIEEAESQAEPAAGGRDNAGPGNLMQRMTDALSRMLNDPSTRNAMRSARTESQAAEEHPDESEMNETEPEASGSSRTDQSQSNQTSASGDAVSTDPANAEEMQTNTSSDDPVFEEPLQASGGQELVSNLPPSDAATARSIDTLQESISSLREEFLDKHKVEPNVNLSFRSQGVESSVITLQRSTTGTITGTSATTTSSSTTSERPEISSGASLPLVNEEAESPEESPEANVAAVESEANESPADGGETNAEELGAVATADETERTIEFPSGVSGMANFTDAHDNDCDDEVQEYELEEGEDDRGRPVLQPDRVQKFIGHRNARTMIKEATWWGNDFVLSGSDCGHIFGWDRKSEKLVLLLEADRHVVNCVQAHPFDPVLISSGIDYNVKVWTPNKEEPDFNEENARTLANRNQIMLEETMDTITVPATLMIRMLASLNQFRRAGRLIPRAMERREVAARARDVANNEDNDEDEQQLRRRRGGEEVDDAEPSSRQPPPTDQEED